MVEPDVGGAQCCGELTELEPPELCEIAPSLGITPDERDRLESGGQARPAGDPRAQNLVNLYGRASPGEHAMADTDVLVDVELDESRNGRSREVAALTSRACRVTAGR